MKRTASLGVTSANRILADRGLWKDAIYALALITYLCSFLFFVLAVGQIMRVGPDGSAIVDLLIAIYFLFQVIFLFALSWFVERRRQSMPIAFPDRRSKRPQ